MTINAALTILPGSCGYGIVYNHGLLGQGYDRDKREIRAYGGTSLRVAAFVDEPRCKNVYDWIKENCEIVYQSKPERNRNSGRLNFLVVFKV